MKNDVIDPREIYKFSKNESVDLNSDSATLHLDNIVECEAKIKELLEKKNQSQFYIQNIMKENEIGINKKYEVKWGSIVYKPQPEKIVPAKDGRVVRRRAVTIKKIES
tara:strand:- start:368 stop:691 length:324 start_codon:yes stop_codon:yes gene_type:complete